MRALVTGSSGFLGRHFVRRLSEEGWLVTGVDTQAVNNAMDARDVFRRWSGPWDLVIHCAAVVNGRRTIEHTPMDQVIDFELDAALFRWAAEVGVGKLVYFSSSAAYPVWLQSEKMMPYKLGEGDINLDDPQLPDALYGWTKLTGEMIARTAQRAGQDLLIVRPFSGYGFDQDDCYPFPAIMRRAHDWHDPFVVWGSGNQVRDFVHVDDIVGAVIAFLKARITGPINIGTGIATSMSTLATMAAAACGYTPTVKPQSNEPEGVFYRVADISLMSEYYQPKVSLEEGIQRALRSLSKKERQWLQW